MSNHTITLPDELYRRLEVSAQRQGLGIEELIARWERGEAEQRRREEAVQAVRQLQKRLSERYGEMEDSVPLLRADRER